MKNKIFPVVNDKLDEYIVIIDYQTKMITIHDKISILYYDYINTFLELEQLNFLDKLSILYIQLTINDYNKV